MQTGSVGSGAGTVGSGVIQYGSGAVHQIIWNQIIVVSYWLL